MKDLISRQAVIEALKALEEPAPTARHLSAIFDCEDTIKTLPSAQPKIVRCKDCKHSEFWYRDKRRCFLWHEEGIDVFEDGFCNYAERRTDGRA